MSYYNDIMVVITVGDEETFKRYLKELKAMEIFKHGAKLSDNGEDGIKIAITHINHWRSHENDKQFMQWLDTIEEDEDTSYHYVRIGENLEDIEENIWNDPVYWVYIERSLSSDF